MVDMNAIKNNTLNLENVTSWPALRFERTYRALINVLYKPTSSAKPIIQPSNIAFTPPNQTTVPADPNFSKESTISTGSTSSAASKAEHFTEKFADAFIEASFESISRQLGENIPWLDPRRQFRLIFPFIPLHPLSE
jgi:hypothetical protein